MQLNFSVPLGQQYKLDVFGTVLASCADFVSQSILVRTRRAYYFFYSSKISKIYRCWIVWSRKIGVIIIPSILALAFLGLSTYLRSLADSKLNSIYSL
jgi:hypothetical protein